MAIKRMIFGLRKSLKSLSGGCILYSQTVTFECSCQEKKSVQKKNFLASLTIGESVWWF